MGIACYTLGVPQKSPIYGVVTPDTGAPWCPVAVRVMSPLPSCPVGSPSAPILRDVGLPLMMCIVIPVPLHAVACLPFNMPPPHVHHSIGAASCLLSSVIIPYVSYIETSIGADAVHSQTIIVASSSCPRNSTFHLSTLPFFYPLFHHRKAM